MLNVNQTFTKRILKSYLFKVLSKGAKNVYKDACKKNLEVY